MKSRRAAYTGTRADILNAVQRPPKSILDVGCSDGSLARECRRYLGDVRIVGVELDSEFCRHAEQHLDHVINADIETLDKDSLPENIDTFFLADVIEHTRSPDLVLQLLQAVAAPNAQFVISVPNVQHWTAIKNLLTGDWPERDRGLFDSTHLRFFTLRSLRRLLARNGLKIIRVSRHYRIFDRPDLALQPLARLLGFWPFRAFITYQYVVTAIPEES